MLTKMIQLSPFCLALFTACAVSPDVTDHTSAIGSNADLDEPDGAEPKADPPTVTPPKVDPPKPAEDECSDDQRKGRLEAEKALGQKLVDNKCMPDNFKEEPCKGLRVDWESLKDANARCNAKALKVSLCTYYEDLVKKYESIVAKCDKNEIKAPVQEPFTVEQYCDYGRMSLAYFKTQVARYCEKK